MFRARASVLPAGAGVPSAIARRSIRRFRGWLTTWRSEWGEDKNVQALARIDNEHLSELSELGQQLRRKALQGSATTQGKMPARSMAVHLAVSSALVAALFGGSTMAGAAEIRLLSAAAMQSVFKEIAGEFERSSGHRLIIRYGTVGGVTQRVLDGELVDVVIASTLSMPTLVEAGRIDPHSPATICKTGIGIVVPSGTPLPRMASVEDFKQALLAARTIVYADPVRGGAAGVHVATVIEKLGIAEQLKPRTRLAAGGDVTEVTLALGDGTLGITQVSEIVQKLGTEFVGVLPEALQNYTVFMAGTPTGTAPSEAVGAFMAFLKGPLAIATIKAKGMQPD